MPVFLFLGSSLEALPPAPSSIRSDLLLTSAAPKPALDVLQHLDYTVVASYPVGPNESLYGLCRRYDLDSFTVRSSNDLDVQILEPGTTLDIPNKRGTLYEVTQTETLRSISQGYERGRRLGAAFEREILEANFYPAPDFSAKELAFAPGTRLFLPGSFKPTGVSFAFSGQAGYRISSGFQRNRRHPVTGTVRSHRGFDVPRAHGSVVLTARDGVVTFAGWQGGYGNMVEVRHVIKRRSKTLTLYTRYGHLSSINVNVGQRVRMYQQVGRVGSTGLSTGPHLHFEVRDENGVPRNPGNFL